jgi:hypothetical protein
MDGVGVALLKSAFDTAFVKIKYSKYGKLTISFCGV